ncbi:diguanylate cyclase [Bermanella sp. R86510]|uniref:diguanylate cyclase n=1 Tax=unclassified Bermanella TaxID=2627862 RepID=UPI0037C7E962
MSRILIVDDVASNVQILSVHLQDEGYRVMETQRGDEAIELLKQHSDIDLVLLDVEMPKMSGLEVLKVIKSELDTKDIPVILVTANGDDDSVVDGLDMGAFDYVIKPYSLSVLMARVRSALREKERLNLLEKWATTDPLTGLYNRRYFFEQANREIERSTRNQSPVTFVIMDIDHFKKVNDQYGHLLGDDVLEILAALFKESLRKVDICCRFGGEEFVLCLPDTDQDTAFEVAERVRKQAKKLSFETDKETIHITISMGIASYKQDDSLETLLKRADEALYLAKDSGRDQTQISA